MSEQPGPREPKSQLVPPKLIVNKNKATIAGRCSSAFAGMGFAVEEQGYKTASVPRRPTDMFRDAESIFQSSLYNQAGHRNYK